MYRHTNMNTVLLEHKFAAHIKGGLLKKVQVGMYITIYMLYVYAM